MNIHSFTQLWPYTHFYNSQSLTYTQFYNHDHTLIYITMNIYSRIQTWTVFSTDQYYLTTSSVNIKYQNNTAHTDLTDSLWTLCIDVMEFSIPVSAIIPELRLGPSRRIIVSSSGKPSNPGIGSPSTVLSGNKTSLEITKQG